MANPTVGTLRAQVAAALGNRERSERPNNPSQIAGDSQAQDRVANMGRKAQAAKSVLPMKPTRKTQKPDGQMTPTGPDPNSRRNVFISTTGSGICVVVSRYAPRPFASRRDSEALRGG